MLGVVRDAMGIFLTTKPPEISLKNGSCGTCWKYKNETGNFLHF